MKKKKKWMRFRHRVIRNIAYALVGTYTRIATGVKVEKFREQGDRPYLIIMNHQTFFDQFFVGMAFSGPVYYLATEDIFSNGWISKLLSWALAPIPIKKQTTDVHAVMNCIRIAKEGGTIALAPEGNRTYSGHTCYFKPSILALVRKLKLPLAIFRIEDGYGVHPRWSDVVRRGKMRAYVSRVVEPEEYEKMTNDELYAVVSEGLYVDEAAVTGEFHHKKLAEYLERSMYVCPFCGLSEFESHGDLIECKKCGRKIRYLPTKELKGEGFEFPFRFVGNWYDYQCDFINDLDVLSMDKNTPIYTDIAALSEVILYKNKQPMYKDAVVELYPDRVEIKNEGQKVLEFPYAEAGTITVLGKNKLNVYIGDKVYQVKGGKRFNAIKYMNFYHRYRNMTEGDGNGKFLGL